jgi:hypothetical protein
MLFMMNEKKARELSDGYRAIIAGRGYANPAFVCPRDALVERQDVLGYCYCLLAGMEDDIVKQKWPLVEKKLIFVQGCLFTLQIFTLDDLGVFTRGNDSANGQAVLPMPLSERVGSA